MFPLRHAARLLTTRSISIAAKPRTITSFASLPSRPTKFVAPIQFQRRWATGAGEAEAQKEDEVPVSQLQPTPQEEVENTIHEDNAATFESEGQATTSTSAADTPIAETSNATEATEDFTTTAAEPESVRSAVDSMPSAAGATSRLAEGLRDNAGLRKPFREPPTPKSTVYVGNLFFDVTENDLTKEFERFGPIKKTRLVRDARGLSKGFGYLSYETTEIAQQAIDEMNQQLFEGRRLMVSFAHTEDQPRREGGGRPEREHTPQNPPSKTLFIGNMSFEMTDRDLNNLFRGVRNVIDVRVAIDRRTGQPRGFAHADFVDVKSAMDAMKALAGKENYGRKLRVDYSFGPSTAPRNTPR